MATAMIAADALALAQRGHAIFPADGKVPRVKWKDEATTDVNTVSAWWKRWPDATIGLALAPDQMVVDIDDLEAVKASGLEFVQTAGQLTPSGGFHFFYRTDGRPVPQVVKRNGLDTRVGGKGYVIAWDPERIPAAIEWGMAPEWVYEAPERPKAVGDEPAVIGTRLEILSWLGKMAAHVRISESGYLALLTDARANGSIVALDPAQPWTDKDLAKLASEAAKWEPGVQGALIVRGKLIGASQHSPNDVTAGDVTGVSATSFRFRTAGVGLIEAMVRHLKLTSATQIFARRVRWLWEGRLALGTLALIGGREGTGKTIASDTLAADVTLGLMPGEFYGTPRNVVIVTTEDAWDMTVVPRLMAANADLSRVFRAESVSAEGVLTGLSLPRDLGELKTAILGVEAALVILDPLISRLDAELDTHKDAEVRLALEPLVALAEATKVNLLGLIHVNKSSTTDPLTMLMASRAFPAVARAVLFVMDDPDEQGVRLLGQPKNNLGRTDLPTLRYRIEGKAVGTDPEDGRPIEAGKLIWLSTTSRNLTDVLAQMAAGPKHKTQVDEAAEWLSRYLAECEDGRAESSAIKAAASRAGISEKSLRVARVKLEISTPAEGFPRITYWQLPLGTD